MCYNNISRIFKGTKYFILFNVPIIRKHLCDMFVVGLSHGKRESIVNLKKLKKFTYSIFMLYIFNYKVFGPVCACVEIIYLDFFIFKDNLLFLSQSLIFDNSLSISNSMS